MLRWIDRQRCNPCRALLFPFDVAVQEPRGLASQKCGKQEGRAPARLQKDASRASAAAASISRGNVNLGDERRHHTQLLDLADASLVQAKHPILPALLLEGVLEFVPRAQVFATVGTCDWSIVDDMCRNAKPDFLAVRAFE